LNAQLFWCLPSLTTFTAQFHRQLSLTAYSASLLFGRRVLTNTAPATSIGKSSGSYGDTCSILVDQRVDSRSGNAARCPSVSKLRFGRESASDLIPRMSAATS
jgi:hypothetical protein